MVSVIAQVVAFDLAFATAGVMWLGALAVRALLGGDIGKTKQPAVGDSTLAG
jgi:hypothetical protein